MIITHEKLIKAGNLITHYKFEHAICCGENARYSKTKRTKKPDPILLKSILAQCDSSHRSRLSGSALIKESIRICPVVRSTSTSSRSRKLAVVRAVSKVYDLLCCNAGFWFDSCGRAFKPVFYTINFHKILPLDYCHREFKLFIKKLNYHFKLDLKYLAVVEYQKRGAVHYHMVLFNMPYISFKELDKYWCHNGTCTIKLLRDTVGMADYITKELSKTFKYNELDNRKKYFCSKNLLKPVIEYSENKIKVELNSMGEHKIFKNKNYNTKFLGEVSQVQYLLL